MVASGDLTAKIDQSSKDEIGELMRALDDMNNALRKIVGVFHPTDASEHLRKVKRLD